MAATAPARTLQVVDPASQFPGTSVSSSLLTVLVKSTGLGAGDRVGDALGAGDTVGAVVGTSVGAALGAADG